MPAGSGPEQVALELVAAFGAGDNVAMQALMADDVRAYITNREGGVDAIAGAKGYLGRIEGMDLPSAQFRVDVTQSVTVRPDTAMIMVEVHARRGERTLHNFAAHLMTIDDGRVREWWMVEALPAASDAFWAER
jgi:SnoaL-like domain